MPFASPNFFHSLEQYLIYSASACYCASLKQYCIRTEWNIQIQYVMFSWPHGYIKWKSLMMVTRSDTVTLETFGFWLEFNINLTESKQQLPAHYDSKVLTIFYVRVF